MYYIIKLIRMDNLEKNLNDFFSFFKNKFLPNNNLKEGYGKFEYKYDSNELTYDEHEKRAKRLYGASTYVTSIHHPDENTKIENLANGNNIWIGGMRDGGGWRWSDGSTWERWNNWGSGEPNNTDNKEDRIIMGSDGKWNDIYRTYKAGAVYKITNIKGDPGPKGERGERGRRGHQGRPGEVTDEFKAGVINVENSANDAEGSSNDAQNSADDAVNSANDAQESANDAQKSADTIEDAVDKMLRLQSHIGSSAAGQAMRDAQNDILLGDKEDTFIGSIREGYGNDNDENDYTDQQMKKMINYFNQDRKNLKDYLNSEVKNTNNNKISEILSQDNNIVNNILFDHIIDNENGSNIEKVYKNLDQENTDTLRKIQIKSYYNKAYNEYIFILKVIIFLIVLLLPIIFLNKYEFISNNITLTGLVFIITIGFLFVTYRMYLLHMKDDIDFDRINIPYDRQTKSLIEQRKMKSKGSILKNLGVVCIGDECCDASMVYDNLRNKCILSENFGGYFESIQNEENKKINLIEPYIKEGFVKSNLKATKEELLTNSLVKSKINRFI